jgi:hypothetical protein
MKNPMRIFAPVVLFVPLAVAGCGDAATTSGWSGTMTTLENGAVLVSNPATGLWGDGGWTLTEELRIGRLEGEGPDLFGDIYGVAADDEGRIWVLDRQAKELRVFSAEGQHLWTLGREGGGPEEFRDPIGLDKDPQGRFWVVDPGNGRYSIWNPDGTHAENWERPLAGYSVPWPGMIDREGRLMDEAFVAGQWIVLRFNDTGQPVDTVPVPRRDDMEFFDHATPGGGRIMAAVPFRPGLPSTLDRRGYIWSGRSENYRLVQQDLATGDTARIVEREWQPAQVTREDREQAVENLEWFTRQGGRVDASRMPSTKPAFSGMMVDDLGHLWVAPPQGEGEAGRTFDLFDPEGRFLGTLTTPVAINRRYTHFSGDHLYTVATDDMDVPYVVRMRLDREARSS